MQSDLHFKNGKFKIMQIADTQETANVNSDTIKLIDLALKKEKPDLVVFTGDQIMGYSPTFKKDTFPKISKTIKALTSPVIESKTPFCATFGNHDRDCGISNETQLKEIYQKLPYFVYTKPMSDDDCGSYAVQIKSEKTNKSVFCLYLIDSNAKKNGSYEPVYEKQIEAFKAVREEMKDESGNYLASIVFQHIPVPEFYDLIFPCKKHTKGAVEAFKSRKGQFFVLDDETKKNGGFMGETPASPEINTGEFDAIKEKGNVLAMFVGHDHANSFAKELDGVLLGYTQGCGFNTYGPGKKRGVRIIELDENNPKLFKTRTVTMQELSPSFKPSRPIKEFFLFHGPTSIEPVKKAAAKAAVALSASTLALACFKKIIGR